MYNKKMQYIIKSVPIEDKQALENLLNQMTEEGWDLYTMHEIETDESVDFNCIFLKERKENDKTNLEDIVDVTNFKHRMEKMLSTPANPYDSCKEIMLKIANKKETIKKIKSQLEVEDLSKKVKNELNNQMSEELKNLENLKQVLVDAISPDSMYKMIKEETLSIDLSDELLNLISLNEQDNILSQTVRVRQKLTDDIGYVIPHIYFHNSDELSQYEFCIKVHDIEVFKTIAMPNYRVFYKDKLKGYKVSENDIVLTDEITGRKIVWLPEETVKDFWENGLTTTEYIGKALEHVAIKEVSDILDYSDINKYIEIVLENNSFLVDNIIPDFITVSDLKYLLTCLIRERIPVKNINYLFEKINDYANEPTKEDLLDKVRFALSKHIFKNLSKQGEVNIIEFTDETLDIIYDFLSINDDDSIIKIDATKVQKIAKKINKLAQSKDISNPIIVVPFDIRHMTFVIFSEFIPNLTVLANEELAADYDLKFIGSV